MPENLLEGCCIGVTADRRWDEQAELLRRRGATIVHGPSIRTLPLGPGPDLRSATEELIADPPAFLLANTGIGIRAWFAAADSWGLGEDLQAALRDTRVFARGPKASAEVHRAGLEVEAKAASERLEEIIDLLTQQDLTGQRLAFQRHGEDSTAALEPLVAAGATIIEVPVYRWILPDDHRPVLRLIEAAIAGRLHALTFTSAPAVRNFFAIADDAELGEQLRRTLAAPFIVACVGPVCAEAARAEGVEHPVVPDRARLGPMIRALTEALVAGEQPIVLDGTAMVLRGNAVVTGDTHVSLSDREAALLRVLLEGNGTVCSKAALLEAVWGDANADPHLVEVMVGRLRRRLGAAGAAIVSVPRRGYTLR